MPATITVVNGQTIIQAGENTQAAAASANAAAASAASAAAAVAPMQYSLRTGAGRGLYKLKTALSNPLCQFVGLLLVGNSITWGWGASGGLSNDPREGTLRDTRNNATSPSFANLLHAYFGKEYYGDSTVTATAWPSDLAGAGGVAIFQYANTIDLFPDGDPFTSTNDAVGGVGTWSATSNGSALTGYYWGATIGASVDNLRLAFRFTGYEFDHVFAALSDGANYEVYVDGVALSGPYTTNTADLGGSDRFGEITTIDLGGFVDDALIEIKVVPGVVGRTIFRTEAIRVNRVLRVTNNGINGSDAVGYNAFITDAISDGDRFAYYQHGSNDRLLTAGSYAVPTGTLTPFKHYAALNVQALQDAGLDVILAVDPAAQGDVVGATYKFTMSDARGALMAIADQKGVDFIDHYWPTKLLLDGGDTSWLADSVHPNDTGHSPIFGRIRDAVETSAAR